MRLRVGQFRKPSLGSWSEAAYGRLDRAIIIMIAKERKPSPDLARGAQVIGLGMLIGLAEGCPSSISYEQHGFLSRPGTRQSDRQGKTPRRQFRRMVVIQNGPDHIRSQKTQLQDAGEIG